MNRRDSLKAMALTPLLGLPGLPKPEGEWHVYHMPPFVTTKQSIYAADPFIWDNYSEQLDCDAVESVFGTVYLTQACLLQPPHTKVWVADCVCPFNRYDCFMAYSEDKEEALWEVLSMMVKEENLAAAKGGLT